MKTLFAVVLGLGLWSGAAVADVLTVHPSETRLLRATADQPTRAAIRFDLSGLRRGPGLRIEGAMLEWPVEGLPMDRRTEQKVYRVLQPWGTVGNTLTAETDSLGTWEVEPEHVVREGRQVIRVMLDKLVAEWVKYPERNYGLVLSLGGVPTSQLDLLSTKLELTVRYGFVEVRAEPSGGL